MATASSTFTGSESPISEAGLFDSPGAWGDMRKVSGILCPVAGSTDALARCTTAFGNDQYSQATWANVAPVTGGNGDYHGVNTRIASSSDGDSYNLSRDPAAGDWKLYRVSDGGSLTFTQLGASLTGGFAANDVIELRSIGTSHEGFRNGVSLGSRTDATYATGYVGPAGFDDISVDTTHGWTSWEGGDVGGATAYTGNVSETVSLSEATTALFAAKLSVTETPSLSEATSAAYAAISALSETASIAEAQTSSYAASPAVIETATLDETQAASYAASPSVNETADLDEDIGGDAAADVGLTETVDLDEEVSAIASVAQAETVELAETVALDEAVVATGPSPVIHRRPRRRRADYVEQLADVVRVADGLSHAQRASVPLAELVASAEVLNLGHRTDVSVGEGVPWGEDIADLSAFPVALADDVSIAERVAFVRESSPGPREVAVRRWLSSWLEGP